jgi:hypothetical protein
MNDYSEVEKELRKLRPAQPSTMLFERVGEALNNSSIASVSDAGWSWWRFKEWRRKDRESQLLDPESRERTSLRFNWVSLGFGLAATAVFILLAVVTVERRHDPAKTVASLSPSGTQPAPLATERLNSRGRFVPAGGMNVVYNARDEGLHFADGSERPLRRVRYNTQQTWRWRNPETGASLRVSYPSEEIVLIPVSGQ